jgi:hypothetical protein
MFGTKDYHPQFEWSAAPLSPKKSQVTSYGFTFSYGILGIQAQGMVTKTPIAAKSAIQSSQEQDVHDILATCQGHHVLVYDNSMKLGYYLPQVSAALQLAHSRVAKCGYRLFKGEVAVKEDESFMFANPGADGNAEACLALKECLNLKECFKLTVRKDQTDENPARESFIEFFRQSWHTLSDIAEGLNSADEIFQVAGDVAPKYIHRVEVIDAMNIERLMKIKRVKIDQPWAHLTSEQPVVLLSKNLLPPIISESRHLCKSWTNVPPDKNYLVATGALVQSLLERQTEGLAQGLDWDGGTPLVESHEQGRQSPIFHSQKLRSKKKPHSNASIRNQIQEYLNSAFVFGDGTEKKCKEGIGIVSLDSPRGQRPSVHYHINKPLPSIPSSASDTSVNLEDILGPDSLGDENSSFVREHGSFSASPESPTDEFGSDIRHDSTIDEQPFKRLSSFCSRIPADEVGIFEPRPSPIEPFSRKMPRYNSQTGATHHPTTPTIGHETVPVDDMSRTLFLTGYLEMHSHYMQSAVGTSGGALPTSSYSRNAGPTCRSIVDTHSDHGPATATTWTKDAPHQYSSYPRRDDYISGCGQSSLARVISSGPIYPPAGSSSRAASLDTQPNWSTQVHPPYDDDELELSGQEEAQATRRHRGESLSTTSGGRSGESQQESDRYSRDRRRK